MTKAASKKSAPAALQSEITTEQDWEEILKRKGLILVQVYSEWSGPCLAMVSTLKRIKMDMGPAAGDTLSYAIVRNDDVSSMERFRGKSEPVWIFIESGKMVNLVFGSHCPNLRRTLIQELRRVEQNETPNWSLSIDQRGPEEQSRWIEKQETRKAIQEAKIAKEEAEKREKYQDSLERQMTELCEETAIILYPWIFLDEKGHRREKENCPAYTELVDHILPRHFDILERIVIQLNDEIIEKMFIESEIELTRDIVKALTRDKCMAIRLKGRAPPPEWPVAYPFECPRGAKHCPVRAINDVENYLYKLLEISFDDENSTEGNYYERHVCIEEPRSENDQDSPTTIYPAVWIPPRARSKVFLFKALFGSYMEKVHPYEEPVQPPPLCAFKFDASKLSIILDIYRLFNSAIVKFGVFQFDDPSRAKRIASNPEIFETKVKNKTGNEVFVIVLRRMDEQVFLAFAGNEPFFVSEDNDEAAAIIEQYFPDSSSSLLDVSYQDYYYDDQEQRQSDEPSFVDLSVYSI